MIKWKETVPELDTENNYGEIEMTKQSANPKRTRGIRLFDRVATEHHGRWLFGVVM